MVLLLLIILNYLSNYQQNYYVLIQSLITLLDTSFLQSANHVAAEQ